MTSEQWFDVADVCLLLAVSSASVLALMFVGAVVIDWINRMRTTRAAGGSTEEASGAPGARKLRAPIFVPKPAARRQPALASATKSAPVARSPRWVEKTSPRLDLSDDGLADGGD
ncbi:hypothetical protein [Mycobacterium sp. MS1601]|uniref:hypothetical protein n=1 Tax=Mycobacterium sp. MS1601 TaxID=1936029 RepID=UPI001A90680A|nr:hypothetical protein [Mycobacterium sp. MS1601]